MNGLVTDKDLKFAEEFCYKVNDYIDPLFRRAIWWTSTANYTRMKLGGDLYNSDTKIFSVSRQIVNRNTNQNTQKTSDYNNDDEISIILSLEDRELYHKFLHAVYEPKKHAEKMWSWFCEYKQLAGEKIINPNDVESKILPNNILKYPNYYPGRIKIETNSLYTEILSNDFGELSDITIYNRLNKTAGKYMIYHIDRNPDDYQWKYCDDHGFILNKNVIEKATLKDKRDYFNQSQKKKTFIGIGARIKKLLSPSKKNDISK